MVGRVGARIRSGYDHDDVIVLPRHTKNMPLVQAESHDILTSSASLTLVLVSRLYMEALFEHIREIPYN